MGEFRIGRKFAQAAYPEARRGGTGPTIELGNNYASGPAENTPLVFTSVPIVWNDIASGDPASDEIPIEPVLTGRLLIYGTVAVFSEVGSNADVWIQIDVDGVQLPIPITNRSTCLDDGFVTVPFLVETDPLSLAPHTVTIRVAPSAESGLSIAAESCTIKIQEVLNPA